MFGIPYLSIWSFISIRCFQRSQNTWTAIFFHRYGGLVRFEDGFVIIDVFHQYEKTLSDEVALADVAICES